MTAITIRPAGITDVETVADLFDQYRQFYQQAPDPDLARRFIRDRIQRHDSVILLAVTADGAAAGFCQLYPSFCSVAAAPIFILYDLFVAPDHRKTGTAKALMAAAEDAARKSGAVRIDLSTAKTNLPAQALYESLGWKRDEVFHAYNKSLLRP
jgi:ribosomal protein S18 acetylase RimI-like enzyme